MIHYSRPPIAKYEDHRLLTRYAYMRRSWSRSIWDGCVEMDFLGLLLVAASLALLLLPLGLAPTASKGWKTPSMVSCPCVYTARQ